MSNIDQSYIHKNCIHYKDGFCTLNQISVDPSGTACRRFTPNPVMITGKNEGVSLGSMQPNQEYFPQRGQGYSSIGQRAGLGMGGQRRIQRGRRGRARKRMAVGSFNPNIPLPAFTSQVQEKLNLTHQLEQLKKKITDIKQKLEKGA
jgi:hypothetical protein